MSTLEEMLTGAALAGLSAQPANHTADASAVAARAVALGRATAALVATPDKGGVTTPVNVSVAPGLTPADVRAIVHDTLEAALAPAPKPGNEPAGG